jgi:ATP-dependent DNA helicase RecQ
MFGLTIHKQATFDLEACKSGDELFINGDECLNAYGQPVLKFSKQYVNQIESMREGFYELKSAKVNFIVYWLKEGERL